MIYSLSIEPYRTDRSDFRITVNREMAKLLVVLLEKANQPDLAYNVSSALERWK